MKTEERHAQLELCIPYVFGRLNPGNRKQFEAHMETGCDQCKRELSELYEATALIPLLLRQEAPPSGLRQRLLSRLSSKKSEPPRVERQTQQRGRVETPPPPSPQTPAPARSWYLPISMVMGALVIVALLFFLNDQLRTTGELEKKVSALQAELQLKQDVVEILKAPRVEMVSLTSVESVSTVYGTIFWDPEKRRAALQTANLPVQGNDKQYQLWLKKEQTYFSGGVFDVTSETANVFSVLSLPIGDRQAIDEFAVTMEPRGGSTQPSGTVQLRGATK